MDYFGLVSSDCVDYSVINKGRLLLVGSMMLVANLVLLTNKPIDPCLYSFDQH